MTNPSSHEQVRRRRRVLAKPVRERRDGKKRIAQRGDRAGSAGKKHEKHHEGRDKRSRPARSCGQAADGRAIVHRKGGEKRERVHEVKRDADAATLGEAHARVLEEDDGRADDGFGERKKQHGPRGLAKHVARRGLLGRQNDAGHR